MDAEGKVDTALKQDILKGGVSRPDVQKAFKDQMTRLLVGGQPGFRYSDFPIQNFVHRGIDDLVYVLCMYRSIQINEVLERDFVVHSGD